MEADEQELQPRLDAYCAYLLSGKKFLILDPLCKDTGIEDHALVDFLINGTQLTREAGFTGLFAAEITTKLRCQRVPASAAFEVEQEKNLIRCHRFRARMFAMRSGKPLCLRRTKDDLRGPLTDAELGIC